MYSTGKNIDLHLLRLRGVQHKSTYPDIYMLIKHMCCGKHLKYLTKVNTGMESGLVMSMFFV